MLVLVQEEWEVMDGNLPQSLHRPSVGERGVTSFVVFAQNRAGIVCVVPSCRADLYLAFGWR